MSLHAPLRLGLAVGMAAALVACGGSAGGRSDPPPPAPPAPPAPPPPPAPSAVSGLDQRPDNLSCAAPERVTGSSTVSVERAFPSLSFVEPVAMLQAPGDSSRWFVVEQNGFIRVFANEQNAQTSQVFLDIDERVFQRNPSEAGMLGLAFHPNFPTDNRAYVNYSSPQPNGPLRSMTSEFTSPDGGSTLNPNSERVLLAVNKNFENHNGGQLAFGPQDGFLYVGLGDGGGAFDPDGNAQNPQRLLGKMLRIDVESRPGGAPYAIPADNPFANNPRCNTDGTGAQSCPEIYALGLRNPWRWSFDLTGDLWVGDVGQRGFEEINVVSRGANYGWDLREGFQCTGGGTSCSSADFTNPVAAYGRDVGFSITGGYVYRGTQTTELVGRYVFGDFGGMIASLTPVADGTFTVTPLVDNGETPPGAPGPLQISAFGKGNDGELFALDYVRGHIYRLIFTPAGAGAGGDNVPQQLSATGCVNTASADAPPLLSLIPYTVNAPFWSDGASKERWIGLPNGQNIAVGDDGNWEPPNGTVLVKHFRIGTRLVETRLFMRHPDGVWGGYTYQWNDAATDATRVRGGATANVGGQTWIFPTEAQCMQCHTQAAGFALGLETAQQNRDLTYPQTGRTANQITTLNAINALAPPVAADPPAYADPADASRSLDDRARAYLHTNCANCHRPGGPTPAALDLRHGTALPQTGACDVAPTGGDLGIANARIVAPGDNTRSVLLARMRVRDANAMPPLASNVVDTAGAELIGAWIDSLPASSCQ